MQRLRTYGVIQKELPRFMGTWTARLRLKRPINTVQFGKLKKSRHSNNKTQQKPTTTTAVSGKAQQ